MWELTITLGLGAGLVGGLIGAWLFSGWLHTHHQRAPWHEPPSDRR